MSSPISPPPVRRWRPSFLPAYLGNGLLGLRVPRIPLLDGVAIVSGFAGVHPIDRVEGFARAPYPLAGDIVIGDAALSDYSEGVTLIEQRYDFSFGELTTRLRFDAPTLRRTRGERGRSDDPVTLSVNSAPAPSEWTVVDPAAAAAYAADCNTILVGRLRTASLLAMVPIIASAVATPFVFETVVPERLVTHAVQAVICLVTCIGTLLDPRGTRATILGVLLLARSTRRSSGLCRSPRRTWTSWCR